MFQTLSDKVISGVISLSMLLFSSYEGNKAEFSQLAVLYLQRGAVFQIELLSAFENDFEEIFKSGENINVNFTIKLKNRSEILQEINFCHSVLFDPLWQNYKIHLEEQEREFLVNDYQNMISLISLIEYTFTEELPERFIFEISATMPVIRLETLDKEYDMMMLWKFKKPQLKVKVDKADYEI